MATAEARSDTANNKILQVVMLEMRNGRIGKKENMANEVDTIL